MLKLIKADLYSNAASGSEIQAAASLYGLDPEVPANFTVADGGHIMFEVDGVAQSYKDYKEPMMKDYKTMNSLLETTNQIFNTGQKLDGTKAQLLGTQVEAMLANPDTIKSILAGDFAGNGIDLSGIAYNPEDVAGTRMQVKDAIMGALTQVANEGYAEKERKRKERNNPNPGTPNNSGYSASQKTALNRLSVVATNPNITITIPQQSGKYLYDAELQQFNKVDSDLQPVLDGDGTTHEISLEEYAKHVGLSLDDVKSNLGLN